MAEKALEAARERAAGLDPVGAAEACAVGYDGDSERGTFTVPFLGTGVVLTFPAFELREPGALPPHVVALIVYYLAISDGSEPTRRWISFADLPNGGFYVSAFRGYTGTAIARRFGGSRADLEGALAALGAEPLPGLADAAWRIPALPRVPVALLWWDADDEFEARADLLFDETAARHLPTDGCAVLGSWIAVTLDRVASTG